MQGAKSIKIGSKVTLNISGNKKVLVVVDSSNECVDGDFATSKSPVGMALLGREVGYSGEVILPDNKKLPVKVLGVK